MPFLSPGASHSVAQALLAVSLPVSLIGSLIGLFIGSQSKQGSHTECSEES